MAVWRNEKEARGQIKGLVAEYYHEFKKPEIEKGFVPGERISYASRVYDEKEMCSLVDAALDFWLTTGRFSDTFEKQIFWPLWRLRRRSLERDKLNVEMR